MDLSLFELRGAPLVLYLDTVLSIGCSTCILIGILIGLWPFKGLFHAWFYTVCFNQSQFMGTRIKLRVNAQPGHDQEPPELEHAREPQRRRPSREVPSAHGSARRRRPMPMRILVPM